MSLSTKRPVLYDYFRTTAASLQTRFDQTVGLAASANKGAAREILVKEFLSQILPPHLRTESGEIWDSEGRKTGQLDVVILRSDTPRLPIGTGPGVSPFLAEAVYAAIEVKSFLSGPELTETACRMMRVAELKSRATGALSVGPVLNRPLRMVFAFDGASLDTLTHTLAGSPDALDAVCVLNRGAFFSLETARNAGIQRVPGSPIPFVYFSGRVFGLALFYMLLTTYASSFVVRGLPLREYFLPAEGWSD